LGTTWALLGVGLEHVDDAVAVVVRRVGGVGVRPERVGSGDEHGGKDGSGAECDGGLVVLGPCLRTGPARRGVLLDLLDGGVGGDGGQVGGHD